MIPLLGAEVAKGPVFFCAHSALVYEYGMATEKPFMDHDALVERLVHLGMVVDDPPAAQRELRRLGYHRTASYRYLFRRHHPRPLTQSQLDAREYRADEFMRGARFDDSLRLAQFDARLREVCSRGLLEYEVRLRTAVAHSLAERSPGAHLDIACLNATVCNHRRKSGKFGQLPPTKFEAWRSTYERAVSNNEHEDFVAHHQSKYGTDLPIWATMELLSFGSIPFLLDLMKPEDQQKVALRFGVRHSGSFIAWTRAMVDFRNACAHGARLFNSRLKRAIVVRPQSGVGPELDHLRTSRPSPDATEQKMFYRAVAVLVYLLRSHESGTAWHQELTNCLALLPVINLPEMSDSLVTPERNMGFPVDWETLNLWQ